MIPRTVALNGVEYVLGNITKMKYASVDPLRTGVVASAEPSDTLFNPQSAFSRYRYSWHHGAGQEMDDLREDADPFRFSDSHQIDVWTENQFKVLRPLVMRRTTPAVTDPQVLASGGYLFVTNNTQLYRSTDGVSWEAFFTSGGTIRSLGTDGSTLYVGADSGLMRIPVDDEVMSAWDVPFSDQVDKVAFVAGHLIVGSNSLLREIYSDGAPDTIKAHFQAEFRWTTIFAVGSRIYAGGHAGVQSELYSIVSEAGVLVLSNEATTFPVGELLHSAISHAGVVILCTSKGVRLATIGGDGTLTYGPLIEMANCYAAVADGRFAWVTGTRLVAGWGTSGTVRLALDTFTETLKPAYAWDATVIKTEIGTGVARFLGVTFVALKAVGLYGETTSTYYSTDHASILPFVTSGRLFFGTVEPKQASGFRATFDALIAAEEVSVQFVDELGSTVIYETTDGATLLSIGVSSFPSARHEFRVKMRLTVSPSVNQSPTVRSWRMRAYPLAPPAHRWILPITINARLRRGGGAGRVVGADPFALSAVLSALYDSRVPVPLTIGSFTETVRVEGFEFSPEEWTSDGEYFQGEMLVELSQLPIEETDDLHRTRQLPSDARRGGTERAAEGRLPRLRQRRVRGRLVPPARRAARHRHRRPAPRGGDPDEDHPARVHHAHPGRAAAGDEPADARLLPEGHQPRVPPDRPADGRRPGHPGDPVQRPGRLQLGGQPVHPLRQELRLPVDGDPGQRWGDAREHTVDDPPAQRHRRGDRRLLRGVPDLLHPARHVESERCRLPLDVPAVVRRRARLPEAGADRADAVAVERDRRAARRLLRGDRRGVPDMSADNGELVDDDDRDAGNQTIFLIVAILIGICAVIWLARAL